MQKLVNVGSYDNKFGSCLTSQAQVRVDLAGLSVLSSSMLSLFGGFDSGSCFYIWSIYNYREYKLLEDYDMISLI